MRIPRIRLTYANIVSTMALFLALGGVSYAAVKLPANSVGEKQIKKNAVTGKKIKKNAITGDKIKAGTIKGTDITLASLGKVPSAARADSAGSSDQTIGVARKITASTGGASQDDARQLSPAITVAEHGQVSAYAKCYVYSGTLFLEVFQKTTADGALSSLNTYYYYGSGGYLNTSTPEGQRYFLYATTSNNSSSYTSSNYSGIGSLYGPDGNGLNFQLHGWVKQGNVPTYGNGAFGSGSVCILNGSATKLNAG